jgi:hypothetical protein
VSGLEIAYIAGYLAIGILAGALLAATNDDLPHLIVPLVIFLWPLVAVAWLFVCLAAALTLMAMVLGDVIRVGCLRWRGK